MQTEDRSSSQQVFEESWEVESLGALIVASLSAGFRRPDGLHCGTATLPRKNRLATMHVPTIYPNDDLPQEAGWRSRFHSRSMAKPSLRKSKSARGSSP